MKDKTPPDRPDPVIICGGMGVRISWWVMARIISLMGELGVVSGTALDTVYVRMLQHADPGGHIRRAFAELARRHPTLAEPLGRLVDKYHIEGGKPADKPYKPAPSWKLERIPGEQPAPCPDSFWEPANELQVLTIAANFAEVWLAKEGHDGKVGINYLRKIERPLPWALYGAMLAGVDYVVVGAGSPPEIPGMIDRLACHEPASLPLKVHTTAPDSSKFFALARPRTLVGDQATTLSKPRFLAIVSSFKLAQVLAADLRTRPYGFVIEGPQAGGHSAPPAKRQFDAQGKQMLIYTEEDRADINAIAGLGLPFWLAGAYASPEGLSKALTSGAAGIQMGTVAALCGQSGMSPALRAQVLRRIVQNDIEVTADAMVSPTGFPFKVARIPGTLSDEEFYHKRRRVCDIGQLQVAYATPEGKLDFRCPAEPVEEFTRKGGRTQNTVGRVCLCNGLLATAGLPQVRAQGYVEPPIVTLGNDLEAVRKLLATLAQGQESYSIGNAIRFIQK